MDYSYSEYALLFKALADATRLNILAQIAGKEICACDILENLNITQPTLSYHMKILCDCGLVNGRKDANWMKYTLNNERLADTQQYIESIKIETVIASSQC